MNANYSLAQVTNRIFKPEKANWIQSQLNSNAKRFVFMTVSAFAVGATIGTTLAVALDLPPVLGVCNALHSLRK
jgi:hypothetical protein